ncbi:MAG: hypothetical protein WKG00_00610 [Polyangiaceae bacterium]
MATIAVTAGITAAACGDLFHDTGWSPCDGDECGGDPGPASSGAASGGSSGAGGGAGNGGAGNEGGHAGAPPSYESACMALAVAYCQRLDACHAVLFVTLGGPDCAAAYAAACVERWSAEDVEMTAAQAAACVEATNIGQAACGDVVRFAAGQLQVPECFIPGQRADGAVCLADEQCSGGKCLVAGATDSTPPGCGVCSTVVGPAMGCGNGTGCQAGLRCAGGLCTALGAVDDACGNSSHCFADLRCAGEQCAPRIAEGQPCQAAAGDDSCVQTSVCVSGVCSDWATAMEGEECGKGFITPTLCAPGLYCGGSVIGTCAAQAAEGEPCPGQNVVTGAACTYPAQCFAATCLTAQAETCE